MQTRLPNGQIVYQEDYSCIIEPQSGKGGIFIGNLQAAQNIKTLKKHGIRAILTAAKGIDLNHPKSQIPFYLQVPGQDRDGFDMTRFFNQSVNFIRDALQNTSIMVHCLAGVSRSVCLVLAYFIKCRGFSYDEAYNLVKIKRSIIHPNQGFISQLRKYESQVRANSSLNFSKFQVSSPSKRKYQYYFDKEENKNANPECYKYQHESMIKHYVSPLKKQTNHSFSRVYESPSKNNIINIIRENYQSPSKNVYNSPSKARNMDIRQTTDFSPYINPEIKRIQSFNQTNNYQPCVELKHISPQRRRYDYVQHRGRSNSNLNQTNDLLKNTQTKRLLGNYDRLRQSSTIQLSQELDSKIAAIRQKYSQYAKNQLSNSRRISARQSEPRYNNFMDQNDIRMSAGVGTKKLSSDYQGTNPKFSGRQYGIISNNIGRNSTVGLGLKRLNSLRQGY